MTRWFRLLALVCVLTLGALPLGGCAGSLTRFVVQTRIQQGDSAFDNGNFNDALVAYKLALDLDPQDEHARTGYTAVQLRIAEKLFHTSKFDEALATLSNAARYDPQSVRLAELRSEIEQARVKREIVISNYPTYRETGAQIVRTYTNFDKANKTIVAALGRFEYTYDSGELSKAIRASLAQSDELKKLTGRLESFRQLVEAGTPDRGSIKPLAPAASLLPLP